MGAFSDSKRTTFWGFDDALVVLLQGEQGFAARAADDGIPAVLMGAVGVIGATHDAAELAIKIALRDGDTVGKKIITNLKFFLRYIINAITEEHLVVLAQVWLQSFLWDGWYGVILRLIREELAVEAAEGVVNFGREIILVEIQNGGDKG